MRYLLSLPARINLLGNPTDGNEGDFATLSAAINLRTEAVIEPADRFILKLLNAKPSHTSHHKDKNQVLQSLSFSADQLPLPYTGELDLLKAALNCLYQYSPELRLKLPHQCFRMVFWSKVPRQSGLGGSSLFVLLVLVGLRLFYNLDRRKHNDYMLAELAQQAESIELGITCGFADRYVPLFGGLAYLDYRGKLHQRGLCEEPLVTYERLDPWTDDPPLVAIFSGVQRNSGNVHGQMRPRYLEEHARWEEQGGNPPPLLRFMTGVWETAWRGKKALLEGDLETLGALMNENHRLVNEMMMYCGFPEGAGSVNNRLVDTALANGALGAKLTGAGGGGSVFALTRPGEENHLVDIWRQTATQAGLTGARVFHPRITKRGLIVKQT